MKKKKIIIKISFSNFVLLIRRLLQGKRKLTLKTLECLACAASRKLAIPFKNRGGFNVWIVHKNKHTMSVLPFLIAKSIGVLSC